MTGPMKSIDCPEACVHMLKHHTGILLWPMALHSNSIAMVDGGIYMPSCDILMTATCKYSS